MGFWSWLVMVLAVLVGAVGAVSAGAELLRWARGDKHPPSRWAVGAGAPVRTRLLVRLGDGLADWLEAVVDGSDSSSDGGCDGGDDGGGGGDGGGD